MHDSPSFATMPGSHKQMRNSAEATPGNTLSLEQLQAREEALLDAARRELDDELSSLLLHDYDRKHIRETIENLRKNVPKEPRCFQKCLKFFNCLCAAVMLTAATTRLLEYDDKKVYMDGFYLVFTMYLLFFGVVLISAEYEILIIMHYIEFLLSETGKGLFLIFVGVLLFDERRNVDFAASILISIIGIFNLAAACSRAGPALCCCCCSGRNNANYQRNGSQSSQAQKEGGSRQSSKHDSPHWQGSDEKVSLSPPMYPYDTFSQTESLQLGRFSIHTVMKAQPQEKTQQQRDLNKDWLNLDVETAGSLRYPKHNGGERCNPTGPSNQQQQTVQSHAQVKKDKEYSHYSHYEERIRQMRQSKSPNTMSRRSQQFDQQATLRSEALKKLNDYHQQQQVTNMILQAQKRAAQANASREFVINL